MRSILRHQPAAFVSLLFCLIILAMYFAISRQTGGMFVYPLDDSYIHLALARTLIQSHTWGIDRSHFASTSSSPGWTVLLAGLDLLVGSHLFNGIALNVVFAIGFFFFVDFGLKSFFSQASLWVRYLTLLILLFCTPLSSLNT